MPIDPLLESLTERSKELGELRDSLNSEVCLLNDRLKIIGIGLAGWYVNGRIGIGYTKIGGIWGLAIQDRLSPDAEVSHKMIDKWETWPFCEAPVYLRLSASAWIEQLLNTLIDRAYEQSALLRLRIEEMRITRSRLEVVLATTGESIPE